MKKAGPMDLLFCSKSNSSGVTQLRLIFQTHSGARSSNLSNLQSILAE